MKEGAHIVSSKAFCPLNFRISDRNLGGMCVKTPSEIVNCSIVVISHPLIVIFNVILYMYMCHGLECIMLRTRKMK